MDPEETSKWHRNFAVTCNNEAWALSEKDGRTPDEDAGMLRRAYAAAYHWFQVGNDVQRCRAESLLALVNAILGHGEQALYFAKRNHDFVLSNDSEAWEVAFAHGILAHAAHTASDDGLHRKQYELAQTASEQLADAQDLKIFLATFSRVPKPE